MVYTYIHIDTEYPVSLREGKEGRPILYMPLIQRLLQVFVVDRI